MMIGIDPGITGAWCMIGKDGRIIQIGDMPTRVAGKHNEIHTEQLLMFLGKLCEWGAKGAVIERVGPARGEGSAGAFRYGRTVGTIEACVTAVGLPYIRLTPVKWKRLLGLAGADKNASRQKAINLFPDHAHLFSRVKDHGRAEAALLAWGALQGKFD